MPETAGSTSETRSPPAGAVGELALRIRGGDYHGRVVRIRAAKCTIGSAADCTLRLAAPGIRPLHCIILRGEAGSTVRRWSPDTQLNGRAFSDALLMVGDRLQIGPVELEVLDDAELPQRSRSAASTAEALTLAANAPVSPVADLAGEIVQHIRRDLEREKDVRKRKLRRKRLRQSRERVKELESELQRHAQTTKRLEAEIDRLHKQPRPQPSQPSAELAQAIAERRQLQQSLADVQADLANRDAELAAARAELAEQVENCSHQRTELEQAAQRQSTQCDDQSSSALAELQRERAAWQQERQSLLKSLDDKKHSEHRLEVALAELRRSVDQEHLASATERQQLEEDRKQLEARAHELDELQAWCDEAQRGTPGMSRHAANKAEVDSLYERITDLERQLSEQNMTAAPSRPKGPEETNEQIHEAQQQLREAIGECERLREELTKKSRQLAEARSQHAKLTAQRDELEAKARTPSDTDPRLIEAEQQLVSKAEELAVAQSELEEVRLELKRRDDDFVIREQNFIRRIESLEKLARNLEDELRGASTGDVSAEQAETQRQELEQRLLAAQQQWNDQRHVLEEQALSAHQQSQELEDQVASLRDALSSTRGQVRERDSLLTQLREEVRQQLKAWQEERHQLRQELEAARHGDARFLDSADSVELPSPDSQSAAEKDSSADVDVSVQPAELAANPEQGAPNGNDPSAACEHDSQDIQDRTEGGEELPLSLPVACDPPVRVNDVLARLGAAGVWNEAEEAENLPAQPRAADTPEHPDEPASSVSWQPAGNEPNDCNESLDSHEQDSLVPPSSPLFGSPSGTDVSSGPDDEESIENYMARLLKRVRGDAVAHSFTMQPTPDATIAEDPDVQQAEVPTPQSSTPTEYLPRKSAPELQSDMAAMRELAIHSARQAITQSSHRRYRKRALATTFCAWLSLASGIGLFAWGWDTGNYFAWGGCGVCGVVGLYLTMRRLKMRVPPRTPKPAR